MKIDIKGAIIPNDDKWLYDYFCMDSTCPKQVTDSITQANGQRLEVYINSGGGSIFAGAEIYGALEAYPGEVKIHVVGSACSAASVIACAGKSDMVRTGMFMYHNVSGSASGDYHDMDKSSAVLQTANRAICAAYVYKTGKSEAELLADMDAETWLTAEQAVKKGFIDSIAENQNLPLVAGIGGIIPQSVLNKIRAESGKVHCDIAKQKAQAALDLLTIKNMEEQA
ncbi:MAG: Clp protease ClpP [Angelakisella sp.]